MAIVRVSGPRATRALSEGTATVNNAATVDTGLSAITGGGIGVVLSVTPEVHVYLGNITTPTATPIVSALSLGAANTVVLTITYIFTGVWRRS